MNAFETWMRKRMPIAMAFKDIREGMEIAWDAALEEAVKVCEQKVKRDAEYGGRWGGYGDFMGDRTGPECAKAIQELSTAYEQARGEVLAQSGEANGR